MTHEHRPNAEHEHGPEHTHGLPDADTVPVHAFAEDSDLPPLPDDPADADVPHPGWAW